MNYFSTSIIHHLTSDLGSASPRIEIEKWPNGGTKNHLLRESKVDSRDQHMIPTHVHRGYRSEGDTDVPVGGKRDGVKRR